MNKIRFIYLLVLLSILVSTIFTACKSDSEDGFLEVKRVELTFSEIGTQAISITTNESWRADIAFPAGTDPWFTIDPQSGQAGSQYISVQTTESNYGREERSAVITISTASMNSYVDVKQSIKPKISLSSTKATIPSGGGDSEPLTVEVNTNWTLKLLNDASFDVSYSVSPSDYGKAGIYAITFTATEGNYTNASKTAKLVINSGKEEKTIDIEQEKFIPTDLYKDKDIVTLQQSTIGRGVNLLFMGDGFTQEMMGKGSNGVYEKAMRQAMDNFFSIEPYKSYRNYFNVYMVAAVSESSVIGNSAGNTKFKCYFGNGTLIQYNDSISMDYVRHVFGNTNVQEGDISVGLILNSTRYAGTCTMWSHGLSISRVPMSTSASPNNFKGLVQHEMGGHGFARVADEYIYYSSQIPQSEVALRRQWHGWGAYLNVDFTSNVSQVLWKDFIGLPKYSDVDVYEGGLTYGKGVWRPESNSCMNNNVPYYNAPTRWAAVRRIMNIAGVPFTFEQFVQSDIIDKSGQAFAKSKAEDRAMPPLHPPIMKEK